MTVTFSLRGCEVGFVYTTSLAGMLLFSRLASVIPVFVRRPLPCSPSSLRVRKPETRMRDFFSSHIRNPNTRRTYLEAVRQFSAFCAEMGIVDLAQVKPVHVAAFVELQLKTQSKPTVKVRLAALRMLFDWMVVGQVIPLNPAHAVRGPKHTQRRGKTPVLQADEARTLIDAIDTSSLPGLRDRALIVYTFARVGAAVSMRMEDFYVQGRRGWARLHEKGGKEHEMPTHHNLDRYLEEYIAAAGIAEDRKGPLFRTIRGRSGELTGNSLRQSDVWRMIRRRALAAGIKRRSAAGVPDLLCRWMSWFSAAFLSPSSRRRGCGEVGSA